MSGSDWMAAGSDPSRTLSASAFDANEDAAALATGVGLIEFAAFRLQPWPSASGHSRQRLKPDSASDNSTDSEADESRFSERKERQFGGAQVGDLIQWTSGGIDQFRSPVRVEQLSEDGAWLWVEASGTGIPMNQVEVMRKGEGVAPLLTPARPPLPSDSGRGQPGEQELLRGPLSREVSYRLLVSGDLGPREIGTLIKLLQAQQAILADDDEDGG